MQYLQDTSPYILAMAMYSATIEKRQSSLELSQITWSSPKFRIWYHLSKIFYEIETND